MPAAQASLNLHFLTTLTMPGQCVASSGTELASTKGYRKHTMEKFLLSVNGNEVQYSLMGKQTCLEEVRHPT